MLSLDMVLFEQVLFNLLDNAAKHAPAGSEIRVSAENAGERVPGKHVIVRISDEGPGIPAGETDRIFEKFYRGGGPDRRRAGTGLGLAICRGFVEAMGGTITATHRSDRSGAVFTITLPVPALIPLAAEEVGE
jgi:two-component system sensor histidine kinase KdpD